MQIIKITELINQLKNALIQKGYLTQSQKVADRLCRQLVDYGATKGIEHYTPDLGQSFLASKYPDYIDCLNVSTPPGMRELRRMLSHVDTFYASGTIVEKRPIGNEGLNDTAAEVLSRYEEHLKINCAPATVQGRLHNVKQFLRYLVANNISISDISETDIVGCINSKPQLSRVSVGYLITSMKLFLKYLYETNMIKSDLSLLTPQIRIPKYARIPSVWKNEDVEKLIASVDRGSPVGKRDFAILLIASKTGMRTGDIFSLKKSNFSWNDNKLEIIQNKTSQPMSLPVQGAVGWAIIDYLKNGRPNCDSPYIFVSHSNNSMGEQLKPGYGTVLMETYIRKAGIRMTNQQKHGLHSLRHTLAARLLEAKTPPTVVAEILGWVSPESIEMYSKVNVEDLRQCALNPGEVLDDAVVCR